MATINIFRRQNPPENADAIWHLHSKAKSLVDETVDSDIVRVLRVAIEALAAAAEMQRLRERATPGPWRAQYPRSDDLINVRIFADSEYLGSITNSDQDTDIIKANADLIAASRSDKSAAHVERLVQEVLEMRQQIAELTAERDAAEAELEAATQRILDQEVA